ncbi:protease inhibitor I42 family protein [Plantactinospora sp. S1510]|uniref:Protease inhibitor I42 family protein n=1 Tax=Plantactinospora alkalitolerans TaxID=2789879 RepID=A0ABS0H3P2_9ACTN|nr:protease inhibitor I42 family protein [Plantactinospora alkalitolerans]MBF9133076.1 protease inhibitor I42 family protein [Plantactinospora alkalitolerans]
MANLELTESDGGRSYCPSPGDLVVVLLPETPSSGFRWHLDAVDSEVLAPAGDSFRPDRAGLGGGGTRQLRFTVVGPGRTNVRLGLRRGWEADGPASRRFEVAIQVAGD